MYLLIINIKLELYAFYIIRVGCSTNKSMHLILFVYDKKQLRTILREYL